MSPSGIVATKSEPKLVRSRWLIAEALSLMAGRSSCRSSNPSVPKHARGPTLHSHPRVRVVVGASDPHRVLVAKATVRNERIQRKPVNPKVQLAHSRRRVAIPVPEGAGSARSHPPGGGDHLRPTRSCSSDGAWDAQGTSARSESAVTRRRSARADSRRSPRLTGKPVCVPIVVRGPEGHCPATEAVRERLGTVGLRDA